jgi:hypothetical protein
MLSREVRQVRDLGELPLVVLSRGLPSSSFPTDQQNQQYDDAWQAMQADLAGLSERSLLVSAPDSGHEIQRDQPERVVDAILLLISLLDAGETSKLCIIKWGVFG